MTPVQLNVHAPAAVGLGGVEAPAFDMSVFRLGWADLDAAIRALSIDPAVVGRPALPVAGRLPHDYGAYCTTVELRRVTDALSSHVALLAHDSLRAA